MGRILKRVSLDFDWPLGIVWKGYISPYRAIECKLCEQSGYNVETNKISKDWYDFDRTGRKWCYNITQDEVQALVDKGRLMDFTRTPRNEEQRKIVEEKIKNGGNSWLPKSNGYIPTAEEVNEWSKQGMGHDGINRNICIEARAKRLGVYGFCSLCKGNGYYYPDDKFEKLEEEWQNIEPPEGEGYQLWENTSEGSPKSPVFKTLEELCSWAEKNATTFASFKATKEEWMNMFKEDNVHHKEGRNVFL